MKKRSVKPEINKIHQGDVLTVLRSWPDSFVDCVVTSPPYYGLRDYGTAKWDGGDKNCDHKKTNSNKVFGNPLFNINRPSREKTDTVGDREVCLKCGAKRIDNQIGLEPTLEEYIAKMVEVFREVRRVMKPEATLWLNLGDSYAASRGYQVNGTKQTKNSQPRYGRHLTDNLKPKDLMMVPARVALALQGDGWWIRSEIALCKLNPMPESVTDRPTNATEKFYILTKSQRYYYDSEAVREGDQVFHRKAGGYKNHSKQMIDGYEPFKGNGGFADSDVTTVGRNLRNWWPVTTEPTPFAHFATFGKKWIEPCIKAGTSEKGYCPECGKPWKRVVEVDKTQRVGKSRGGNYKDLKKTDGTKVMLGGYKAGMQYKQTDLGFSPSCTCGFEYVEGIAVANMPPYPVPGLVLDPFMGSGTTAIVAYEHGRDWIGIELSEEYIGIANKRIAQATQQMRMF